MAASGLKPRQNHFIPKFLLKNFLADGRPHLFAISKINPDNKIFATAPHNLFKKRDLYNQIQDGSVIDTKLEIDYSRFEGIAKPVVDNIVKCVREGKLPALTVEHREIFSLFYYQMHNRPPDAYLRVGAIEEANREIDRIVEKRLQGNLTSSEVVNRKSSPDVRSEIIHNAQIIARRRLSPLVYNAIMSRGLAIGRPNSKSKSFVIGDSVFARFSRVDRSNGDELWLPISHDVVVALHGMSGDECLLDFGTSDVRKINESIYGRSTIIACKSDALLRSLCQRM